MIATTHLGTSLTALAVLLMRNVALVVFGPPVAALLGTIIFICSILEFLFLLIGVGEI